MTHRDTPSHWMNTFLTAFGAFQTLPRETALEGLLALAARIECQATSLSLDCDTCPNRETCVRYGRVPAPAATDACAHAPPRQPTPADAARATRATREWWAVRSTHPRIIG